MAPATRGRQLWLIPVLVVVIAVTALGALIARDRYREPDAPPQATAVLPTTSAVPSSAQPGPSTVAGTQDATAHPLYGTTRAVLQSFFDAINSKDYDEWRSSVTRGKAEQTPEPDWRKSYRSTRDGSIVIYRIELGANGSAQVLLSFVSTQDLRDAPPELPARCIRWHAVFPLAVEDGTWRVDAGPTGTSPQEQQC